MLAASISSPISKSNGLPMLQAMLVLARLQYLHSWLQKPRMQLVTAAFFESRLHQIDKSFFKYDAVNLGSLVDFFIDTFGVLKVHFYYWTTCDHGFDCN